MKHANVAVFVPHLGCPHRCAFCDQRSISGQLVMPGPEDVADAARRGLLQLGENAPKAELAFFGGSFTAIGRERMESLLRAAAPFVAKGGEPGKYRGIRVSTRPDAIDEDILALLKAYGVTAVELGAQSMKDPVLAANGRGHTAADVIRSAGMLRAAGFELGLQMMTGLYTDTDEGALYTAHALCALMPDTVRVYPTVVVHGTELEQLYRRGLYRPQTLEEAVSLCAGLLEYFARQGIRVIRMGLHASQELSRSYVAGPYHPAFRELCESRLFLHKARVLLGQSAARGAVTLVVHRSAVSRMTGQHRCNLQTLEGEFPVRLRVRVAEGLLPYEIRLAMEG